MVVFLKKISMIFIIIALTSFVFSLKAQNDSCDNNIVVIDAGHGGMDSGAVVGNVCESMLNLEIALELEKIYCANGFEVIMTRSDEYDLCDGDKFIKKEDLNKRVNIINNSNALFCISIHQNKFNDSTVFGSQVLYGNNESANLAKNIYISMKKNLDNTKRTPALRENVYLLKRVVIPMVIVECGFISNQNELNLLKNKDYQKKIALCIYNGSMY